MSTLGLGYLLDTQFVSVSPVEKFLDGIEVRDFQKKNMVVWKFLKEFLKGFFTIFDEFLVFRVTFYVCEALELVLSITRQCCGYLTHCPGSGEHSARRITIVRRLYPKLAMQK